MKNLYGISGKEETLALGSIEPDFDDNGCNDDQDILESFDESTYLDQAAVGAGYDIN